MLLQDLKRSLFHSTFKLVS